MMLMCICYDRVMREVNRDIVGAFIFSSDGKVLLGHNKSGGVYQDQLIVPGGGIEEGESHAEAVIREVKEETGINVSTATIEAVDGFSVGESEKTLRDTGERVLMKMRFYDFKITLNTPAADVVLVFEDDYSQASWFSPDELYGRDIGPATKVTLQKILGMEL